MSFSLSLKKFSALLSAIVALILLTPQPSFAWGQRGHNLICEVATRLVQNPQMSSLLLFRSEYMGHVCNIPDIYWKNLKPKSEIGDAAHFLDPENVGLKLETVPDKIAVYYAHDHHDEDDTIDKKHKRMGSLFWRSQQFYERAIQSGKLIGQAALPTREQEQDDELAYNKNVFDFLLNLGLMGHFVGDASMPYHTTADYDGYGTGNGGIHGFYEGSCVTWYDFGLAVDVFEKAQEMRKQNQFNRSMIAYAPVANAGLEMTRQVAMASAVDLPEIVKLDKTKSPSIQATETVKGVPAKRDSFEKACPAFRSLVVNELARSALALSTLWDSAYADANNPDTSKYRSYKYPFTPDFVSLDYLP